MSIEKQTSSLLIGLVNDRDDFLNEIDNAKKMKKQKA